LEYETINDEEGGSSGRENGEYLGKFAEVRRGGSI
jgi:hypothetical protein